MTGASAPDGLRTRFEDRLNASLTGSAVSIGDIKFALFTSGMNPSVSMHDIAVHDDAAQIRAVLPEVEAELSGLDLLVGKVKLVSVQVKGASLRLKRDADGRFDISVGEGDGGFLKEAENLGDILNAVETAFSGPDFGQLKHVKATNIRLSLSDDLSGRDWQFHDGELTFINSDDALEGSVTLRLANEWTESAEAIFSWRKQKGGDGSVISSKFSGLRTEDVADQVAALDWLRVLNAPIAGSMSLAVTDDGGFGAFNGVLDIGAGNIRQNAAVTAVQFSGAKAYLSYDDAEQKFSFDQITIDTDAAHIVAEGHAYLSDQIDRSVGALIGQLKFTKFRLNPEGIFQSPLEFDLGAMDMRVRLRPLEVDIGQLVLVDPHSKYILQGSLKLGDEGWTSALDLSVKSLPFRRLMELWPLELKVKTRNWVATNIFKGEMKNLTGTLRGQPGQRPQLAVGYDLHDFSFRFLKTMPPITGATGYSVMADNKMHLVLQQGTLSAPDGGEINVAGSVFQVLDTRIKKAPAEVHLKTQSSITSLLSVLDLKPFSFLSKAGMATDIAEGVIATEGKIAFPLKKKVTLEEITLALEGTLSNPSTTKLVKGKTLSAKTMKAYIDNSGLTITGTARIGVVPVSGSWRQKFGPEHKGKSRVEGQIELSQAFLDEFGIKLPKGSVAGKGTGHINIALVRDKAPVFSLQSDLNRMALALPPLGWKKPKNVTGQLVVKGQFSSPPHISSIVIKTKGLAAKGSVTLKDNGSLDVASFPEVNVGGWMKTPVEIRTDRNGQAAFTLRGGVLDFRKSTFGSSSSEGASSSDGSPGNRITVALDRLVLSSGISLNGVTGELNTAGGMTGSFEGTVNDGARLVGTLAPYNNGTAVRFTSTDAGHVMRSAGVFKSAVGGRMDMVLIPSGKSGEYDGSLKVSNTRVRNASALADLLSAISVVGLLEQLGGEGIAFTDINARFRLTPGGVQLQDSSAVGASLGITMDGVYNFDTSTMNMQGVITPIYVLNGMLEQTKIFGGLFGRKKGEGLFGFNYTLKGNVEKPKVGVNPLSLLTPGLFREIFRQPVPEPPQ